MRATTRARASAARRRASYQSWSSSAAVFSASVPSAPWTRCGARPRIRAMTSRAWASSRSRTTETSSAALESCSRPARISWPIIGSRSRIWWANSSRAAAIAPDQASAAAAAWGAYRSPVLRSVVPARARHAESR
jgi:hypothetical protein